MARIGGDELCILLPCTGKNTAFTIAEKLRKIVSSISITTENEDISPTVSIGVAEIENTDLDYAAPLKRADENLYKAKGSGRNRVCK
jgi:diguanylate cyclase (GGDEF)-like protein